MSEGISGRPDFAFMDVGTARSRYELSTNGFLFASQLEQDLLEHAIGKIPMPIGANDFKSLISAFAQTIDEFPDHLSATLHKVDNRFGNEAGYKRKSLQFDPITNTQSDDPKHLIHFNEQARKRWSEDLRDAPRAFNDFLETGYEIHNALIACAMRSFQELESTHPNIGNAHFPGGMSCSFMRLLRYDSYDIGTQKGDIAKPHYDIGGATIQAYADAPGFFGAASHTSERIFYDTNIDEAYLFMGRGYKRLYGENAPFKPLWHGVERTETSENINVPERHAVILFIDAPLIDYGVTAKETLPQLHLIPANNAEAVA